MIDLVLLFKLMDLRLLVCGRIHVEVGNVNLRSSIRGPRSQTGSAKIIISFPFLIFSQKLEPIISEWVMMYFLA